VIQAVALVLRAYDFAMEWEPIWLKEPGEGEVLVRLVACGVCQTDVKVSHGYRRVRLPAVLGHEGAGVVESVGPGVEGLTPGDPVVLSFASCGACTACVRGAPAYCYRSDPLNFGGEAAEAWSLRDAGAGPLTRFFGQSAFASHAVVAARQAVRVPAELSLSIAGPLGCSVQTGAGAILRELAVESGSSVAVLGVGAVGLSAVLAAQVAGASRIVAVDLLAGRLDLARKLGATLGLQAGPSSEIGALLRRAAPDGLHTVLDTTGQPGVLAGAVEALAPGGAAGFVAPGGPATLDTGMLLAGRSVRGITQGGSVPQSFIPTLVELYREGRFPFNRLVRTFPASSAEAAFASIAEGSAVKPVMLFDELA
jgi:aryl-alcohol dehydrogenase